MPDSLDDFSDRTQAQVEQQKRDNAHREQIERQKREQEERDEREKKRREEERNKNKG